MFFRISSQTERDLQIPSDSVRVKFFRFDQHSFAQHGMVGSGLAAPKRAAK